jgi:hypothetical protein
MGYSGAYILKLTSFSFLGVLMSNGLVLFFVFANVSSFGVYLPTGRQGKGWLGERGLENSFLHT